MHDVWTTSNCKRDIGVAATSILLQLRAKPTHCHKPSAGPVKCLVEHNVDSRASCSLLLVRNALLNAVLMTYVTIRPLGLRGSLSAFCGQCYLHHSKCLLLLFLHLKLSKKRIRLLFFESRFCLSIAFFRPFTILYGLIVVSQRSRVDSTRVSFRIRYCFVRLPPISVQHSNCL